ncbi:MAG: Gfo/Idh/MocA family protein [Rectinemataceae bacterium]
MEPVRWGVLSVSGHYALRIHAPLSRLPEATIAAIASRDEERAKAGAARFGIARSYASYEALLADPKVEAVYIPLPNHLHAEWAMRALDAGKHVLCEKPMALDATQAAGMAKRAKERGLLLMEAFMYRFHPQWVRVKEILATGEIGRIHTIHETFTYDNRDPANIRNQKEKGGGAVYDIGCYTVSVARWVAALEPERVVSLVHRDEGFGTDILSSGVLDFGKAGQGLRACFTVATQAFPIQRVDIVGDGGIISLPLSFNAYPDVPVALEVTTSLGTRKVETGPVDQYAAMFAAFSRAVRSGGPAPTPIEDGIANMATMDALFRSERSGGWEAVKRP